MLFLTRVCGVRGKDAGSAKNGSFPSSETLSPCGAHICLTPLAPACVTASSWLAAVTERVTLAAFILACSGRCGSWAGPLGESGMLQR